MPGMQFPYPRKSSTSTPYPPPSRSTPFARKRDLKRLAPYLLGIFPAIFLLVWLFGGGASSPTSITRPPPGTPSVVIVTPLDPARSQTHKDNLISNRRDYAHRHGYTTFFPNTTDYDLMSGVPKTWSTIPALRHAMTKYPHTPWLWYLSSTALIMKPEESLESKLLDPRKLETLLLADKPVVPPDSVIKTFPHLRGERVDFILTQDREGLATDSFFVRTGEWAKFFLDAWFDPLYRSYNFQKAEEHALEHIVQWHGTVLAKLALVEQRLVNGYMYRAGVGVGSEGIYQEGDFIANFHGCARDSARNCEDEMAPMIARWRELRDQERKR